MHDISKEELEQAYTTHKSLEATAEHLKCSAKVIKKLITKYNIEYKPIIVRAKYELLNHNAFSEPTAEAMYWAGFIVADGNLYKYKDKENYRLRISLSINDLTLLEQFKEFLKTDVKIAIGKRKSDINPNGIFNYCEISIHSKQIFTDLLKYGITPNKTFTYKMPDWIKDSVYLNQFILGLIHGDGWIREDRDKNVIVGLCGASSVVKDIYDLLKSKLNLKNDGTFSITGKCKDGVNDMYSMTFQAHHDVLKILEYLHNGANINFERKNMLEKARYYSENSRFKNISDEQIISTYNELKSIKKTAEKLDAPISMIRKAVHGNDIKLFNTYKDSNIYNENYFDKIDSIEKIYWLGFITANSSFFKSSHGTTHLKISYHDESHLNKFLQNTSMKLIIQKDGNSNFIVIRNNVIVNQLISYNCNIKTDYIMQDFIKNNNEYSRNFIRGVIDGKSCLTYQYNYNKSTLQVIQSKQFIEDFYDHIKNNIKYDFTTPIHLTDNKEKCKITFINTSVRKIVEYLYKDSDIYADSKYNVVKEILN